jgi:hypothetical protein
VSGAIAEDSGATVAGAIATLADARGPYATAVADASGSYSATVERGSYMITPSAPARSGTTQTVDLSSGAPMSAGLLLSSTGRFTLDVRDGVGAPSPARVQLFGSDSSSHGYLLSPDGTGDGLLPPGDYRAVISRGYEFEAATVNFSIAAGASTPVSAKISRVVDTTGWVAIDSHTHTAISVDSTLDPHARVRHALADGVELVITTDHDVLFDLAPTVAEMGLAGGFATAIGCEVSPVPGHINGYPLTDPTDDGYWAVKWWSETDAHDFVADLWPTDLFAALRSRLSAEIVQLNHPRSGQGSLNWVGYDPARGMAATDLTQLDGNWDVIEVCNAGCDRTAGSEDDQTLHDFYSFLSQGMRKGAVGVSDAHTSDSILGRARTMVQVHDDDPRTLDANEVWSSLKSGRGVVLDGPFVTLTVTDDASALEGVGQLARTTAATVTLHVKVQAPSWISTDTIQLVVNGKAQAFPIPPSTAVVRYDADLKIPSPGRDAWVLAIVDGNTPMAPVLGSPPRTITNPIYLDVNANGTFDAPGL